jgi:hypothetical protein
MEFPNSLTVTVTPVLGIVHVIPEKLLALSANVYILYNLTSLSLNKEDKI